MRGESIVKSAVVVLLWGLAVNVSTAKYSGGTGEPNDPYRIATPNDLNDIGNHIEDFNKCFVMVNDINLADYAGTQFNIIGSGDFFCGVFDGNGHAISNFTYDGEGANVGLFGRLQFFWLEDASWPFIKDLTLVEPNVNAPSGDCAGGLVGSLGDATVRDCRIQGGRISGGSDCMVGGLVGHNGGIIEECSSTATVSGGYHVGGLVGAMIGFKPMGINLILNCHSAGSVSGPANFIGGLVGGNAHSVENSYSSGQVAPDPNAGGFVGYSHEHARYVECFWDNEVNPDVNGIGNGSDPNVIGKTTAEMHRESTFTDAGWDFVEVWDIGENQTYPFLRVYPAGDMNHDGIVDWRDFAILAGHWLEGTE
ncbi:MAG: GLUG motif-containing protein [Planctomycetota bacterium]|jgi:hypothetical protein